MAKTKRRYNPRPKNERNFRSRERVFSEGGDRWGSQHARITVDAVRAFYRVMSKRHPETFHAGLSYSGVADAAVKFAASQVSPAGQRAMLQGMAFACQGVVDALVAGGHLERGFKVAAADGRLELVHDGRSAKAYAAGTIDAIQLKPTEIALA